MLVPMFGHYRVVMTTVRIERLIVMIVMIVMIVIPAVSRAGAAAQQHKDNKTSHDNAKEDLIIEAAR